MYGVKMDGWKVFALNNEHHVMWLARSSSFSSCDFLKSRKKNIDLNPGKKEQGENNMSLQIACLLLKYDVLITAYDRVTAGLW